MEHYLPIECEISHICKIYRTTCAVCEARHNANNKICRRQTRRKVPHASVACDHRRQQHLGEVVKTEVPTILHTRSDDQFTDFLLLFWHKVFVFTSAHNIAVAHCARPLKTMKVVSTHTHARPGSAQSARHTRTCHQ